MASDYWQIFMPVLSVSALVIVARYRDWMCQEDADGFRNTVIGLSIFACTTLAPIYESYGLLVGVPFLNDPLFFSLVTWIAVLTGVVFLASGVSSFLPLAREQRRYNRTVIARLELLKEVEQLIGIETRPDAILAGIINHVAATYPIHAGAAFTYDDTTGHLKNVSTFDDVPVAVGHFENLTIDTARFIRESRAFLRKNLAISGQISSHDLPSMVLPIASGGQLFGALFLWFERGFSADDSSRMNLKLVAEIAGRSIDANDNRKRVTCHLNYCHLTSAIDQLFSPGKSVKDTFKGITQVLCHVVGAESVTLVIRNSAGEWHRLSSGLSDTILHEKKVNFQKVSIVARQACSDCVPIYHQSCRSADMIRSGKGRSEGALMALPIVRAGEAMGVVSLMSSRESAFDGFSLDSLVQTVSSLGELVWQLDREQTRDSSQRRQQLVRAFVRDSYNQLSTQEIFEDLARVVSLGIRNDVVRVCTFDRQGQYLNSRALVDKTGQTRIAHDRAVLILDMLPTHKLLSDGRRSIVMDLRRDGASLSEAEMSHMFGDKVATTLLVPISHEGEVVGTISIARKSNGTSAEFCESDITFTELVAAVASLALRQASLDRWVRRSRLQPQQKPETRSRIKSSLSGIVGSLEMLRQQEHRDEVTRKYLDIIDRSAQRLGETVEAGSR